MAIFLITPIARPDSIIQAIKTNFPDDSYVIPSTNSVFVKFSGTSKEISDKLKISDGETGTGIVVPVTNYYGRAPTDIWEWLKSRMEKE
jgi:hypothetical protein